MGLLCLLGSVVESLSRKEVIHEKELRFHFLVRSWIGIYVDDITAAYNASLEEYTFQDVRFLDRM